MATKNKVNIISDIVAEIKSGNSDTTAAGLRTILYEILDSYVNVKDGGLVYETPVGYNGLLTLTDPKSFVYKKWVEDYISTNVTLASVLANDNKTGGYAITSDDGNSAAHIINDEIFLHSGTTNAGRIHLSQNEAVLFNNIGGFYATDLPLLPTKYFKVSTAENRIVHSAKNLFSAPINEFINGGIYFISGIGIDTTATAGTDVLNIGATNANVINYGNASTVHNFLGTAIYELQVNSYVEDKLITLNYGGSVGSGIGVGFEIEEDNLITGFLKTNATRDGFSFQAPSIVHTAHFLFSSFTADRTFDLPDSSGTLSLQSYVDAKVTDSITDGITTVAPSQNAVFDALGLKLTAANNLSDVSNPLTARENLKHWNFFITGGDVTTTSNVASNITGFVTPTLTINKRYRMNGTIHTGCNNTGGVRLQVTLPTGCTISGFMVGSNIPNASQTAIYDISAGSTFVTSSFNQWNSQLGHVNFMIDVQMSTTAGTIQFGFASGTNTQTSTIYQLGTFGILEQLD